MEIYGFWHLGGNNRKITGGKNRFSQNKNPGGKNRASPFRTVYVRQKVKGFDSSAGMKGAKEFVFGSVGLKS